MFQVVKRQKSKSKVKFLPITASRGADAAK